MSDSNTLASYHPHYSPYVSVTAFVAGPALLAGMMTAGGMYSGEEWKAKCNADPALYPHYFEKCGSADLYKVTPYFRLHYEEYLASVSHNYGAIGLQN